MSCEERDAACALGGRLRAARRSAGLTQQRLAARAQLSERHLRRLERGDRRSRQSTLARLAEVVAAASDGRTAGDLLAGWITVAGVSLAAESEHRERVERRRARRVARDTSRWVQRRTDSYAYLARATLIRTTEEWAEPSRQARVSYRVEFDEGGLMGLPNTPDVAALFESATVASLRGRRHQRGRLDADRLSKADDLIEGWVRAACLDAAQVSPADAGGEGEPFL